MRPPFDVNLIDAITPAVIAEGYRVLQTHRYGADDVAHVRVLLDVFDVPACSLVLDAGCGLGEVSRLMHGMRPDLSFILANLSGEQLRFCLANLSGPFLLLKADAQATGLRDGMVDAVMFNSALCQMDQAVALAEAHRILRPGGRLLLNELVRERGDGAEMERELACRTWRLEQLSSAIVRAGFRDVEVAFPEYDMTHFRELLARKGLQHLAEGVRPVIVTATKAGA